jgi:long-subunit fatty acid transport protein
VGYNFGRTPIRNSAVFQNVLIPATTESHITAGFSYEIGPHIGMDAAYIHEFENSVTQDASGSPTGQGAFTGTSVDAFAIGLHAKWGGKKKESKEPKEAQARAD